MADRLLKRSRKAITRLEKIFEELDCDEAWITVQFKVCRAGIAQLKHQESNRTWKFRVNNLEAD